MQIPKNQLKNKNEFLEDYFSESKIEFHCVTEEWMDNLYRFAQVMMSPLYDMTITGHENTNIRNCIRITNDFPGVYYAGYPTVEYCYLVLTDEILDKKQVGKKTNRDIWKEMLQKIQKEMEEIFSGIQ